MPKKAIPLVEQRRMFEENIMILSGYLYKFFDKGHRYVIGVDPSLNATGIAIALPGWDKVLHEVSPEEIRKKDKDNKMFYSVYERISLTRDFLIKHVNKHKALLAVIEGYSYGSTQNRELSGEVGGMVRLNIFRDRQEIGPTIVVAPQRLKKWILGSGQAGGGKKTKQLVILNVFKKLGIEVDDDNEADAIVLADIGRSLIKFVSMYKDKEFENDKEIRMFLNTGWEGTLYPKYQWEVLTKILTENCNHKSLMEYYNKENL